MPDVLLAANEVVTEVCFPLFGNCDPTNDPTGGGGAGGGGAGGGGGGSPYYVECDKAYNNTICSPIECWRMPFDSADSINMQNNLILGQGVVSIQVTDLDDNPIAADVTIVSDAGGSGQTINIENIAAGTCFKVQSTQQGGGLSCISWEYEPLGACPPLTVKISGLYKTGEKDCFGFTYPHDNSIRLKGYLVEGKRSDISKVVYGNHVKKRRVDTYYTLYINDLVPAIIHQVLANQILAANQVKVEFEGNIYVMETDTEFSLVSESTGNRMFHYGENGIPLKFVCEVPGKC